MVLTRPLLADRGAAPSLWVERRARGFAGRLSIGGEAIELVLVEFTVKPVNWWRSQWMSPRRQGTQRPQL